MNHYMKRLPSDVVAGQYFQKWVLTLMHYILPPIATTYAVGRVVGEWFYTTYLPFHESKVTPALTKAFTINNL